MFDATAEVQGSVASLEFFVEGKPISKARPRTVRNGGKTWTYTPKTTVDWESTIAYAARQQMAAISMEDDTEITLPFEGRVIVSLTFYFDKPKSYPKKVRHHLKKPDLDNLAKSVLDALENARFVKNDNIVTDLMLSKRYTLNGEPQGVLIEITGWME